MTKPVPDARTEYTAQLNAGVPFSVLLGVEGVTGSAEELRARLQWDRRRCTDSGTLHGGALMSLADVIAGLVAFLNLPPDAVGTTTIESKTNFFRPVRERFVEAVSKPLHRGRTTIVIDTELRRADGKLVARVTQTQAILYPRASLPSE